MLACVRVSRPRADWKLSAITLLACFIFSDSLRAQAPQPPVPPPVTQESAVPKLPPEALNQLLAPVALYPDALIALILPASTAPSDVVLAARYLSSNGDPAQVANQPWDESVKSLVRYPDVLKWMDQNLEWTTQVGVAFLDQPADVMNAIQQLRAQAIAAGNLVDCPQQKIVKEETCVRIVPAEPELIYVPRYDPEVVYVRPYEPYLGPALTFGVGFAVGSWLNYDCDWPRRQGVCGRVESTMTGIRDGSRNGSAIAEEVSIPGGRSMSSTSAAARLASGSRVGRPNANSGKGNARRTTTRRPTTI